RLRSRVARDDAARGTSRSEVRSAPNLPGGNVGAGARARLRDLVGGGLQPGSDDREEVRADLEPQAVGCHEASGGRDLRFSAKRLKGAAPVRREAPVS